MANPEHLEILKQGVDVWNKWRAELQIILPDLKFSELDQIDLRGFDLSGANFFHSSLAGAQFDAALLTETNFEKADLFAASFKHVEGHSTDFGETLLSHSRFNKAILSKARFNRAILERVNFNGASFDNCNFYRAFFSRAELKGTRFRKTGFERAFFTDDNSGILRGVLIADDIVEENVSFKDCYMGATTFANCDLSKVEDLQTVHHISPSTIGIDTIYKSGGKISETFLKKAGVPETFVLYAKSLMENPIDFYSCFISFTEKDDAFSERLYNDMQAKGVRCWRWKEDAKWGRTLRKEIDEAVRYYDKLVVICSEDSLKAPAVLEEIERALDKEDAQRRNGEDGEVLFPIRIDDFIFDGWESELKVRLVKKNIGDFRDWNGDAEKYRKSVERLVKDLNRLRSEKK